MTDTSRECYKVSFIGESLRLLAFQKNDTLKGEEGIGSVRSQWLGHGLSYQSGRFGCLIYKDNRD